MAEEITEQKEPTLREQLQNVSQKLENLNVTRATCMKLMEMGAVKILQGVQPAEGEEPLSLDINGDVVGNILSPVLNIVNRRREEFLSYKENILGEIEKELTAPEAVK